MKTIFFLAVSLLTVGASHGFLSVVTSTPTVAKRSQAARTFPAVICNECDALSWGWEDFEEPLLPADFIPCPPAVHRLHTRSADDVKGGGSQLQLGQTVASLAPAAGLAVVSFVSTQDVEPTLGVLALVFAGQQVLCGLKKIAEPFMVLKP